MSDKDSLFGKGITYTWAISYSQNGNYLSLVHKQDRAVMTEIIVCNRWVEWVLFHLPWGFKLWDKMLQSTVSKETEILRLPATEEMLSVLSPESRWLWDENYRGDDE